MTIDGLFGLFTVPQATGAEKQAETANGAPQSVSSRPIPMPKTAATRNLWVHAGSRKSDMVSPQQQADRDFHSHNYAYGKSPTLACRAKNGRWPIPVLFLYFSGTCAASKSRIAEFLTRTGPMKEDKQAGQESKLQSGPGQRGAGHTPRREPNCISTSERINARRVFHARGIH